MLGVDDEGSGVDEGGVAAGGIERGPQARREPDATAHAGVLMARVESQPPQVGRQAKGGGVEGWLGLLHGAQRAVAAVAGVRVIQGCG